ncbi:DUF5681 domain-containing protein [Hyphomicrobium sp.]|uniref:DUF5681 domain-containing protein n=1 Tax=Hyphomicrobium sp. TaxID=82 RepID=UPI0025BD98D1|nr:DUF5681 domain-containing protein [Hyphomicrobium sp.]
MKKSKYRVGYGKPPKHSRFKPGQSGNPKGRPKGAPGFKAELEKELRQLITVTEGGRTRKLSKQLAMIKALCAKALKGDVRSVQLILGHCSDRNERAALQPNELDALDQAIIEAFRRRSGQEE